MMGIMQPAIHLQYARSSICPRRPEEPDSHPLGNTSGGRSAFLRSWEFHPSAVLAEPSFDGSIIMPFPTSWPPPGAAPAFAVNLFARKNGHGGFLLRLVGKSFKNVPDAMYMKLSKCQRQFLHLLFYQFTKNCFSFLEPHSTGLRSYQYRFTFSLRSQSVHLQGLTVPAVCEYAHFLFLTEDNPGLLRKTLRSQ